MKVLLYSKVFAPAIGGMERFAEDLAGWLSETGHEVVVMTYTPAGVGVDGGRSYRIVRGPSTMDMLPTVGWADVVHVNGLSVKGIWLALLGGRRPVVTHAGHQAVCPTGLAWTGRFPCGVDSTVGPCSGCAEAGLGGRARVLAHRRAAAAAAANIPVSHYLAGRLQVPRASVIYNPVARRAFTTETPGTGEDDLIAFAGRLVAEKGLDTLLHAVAKLPGVRLEIAGTGPMRGVWEALAGDLGLERRVKFLGNLSFDGVAALYLRSTVVCVPSAWDEPFGYAAAEAMALGCAVVATPRGALPELLREGRGFVAESMHPDALAAALARALREDRKSVV